MPILVVGFKFALNMAFKDRYSRSHCLEKEIFNKDFLLINYLFGVFIISGERGRDKARQGATKARSEESERRGRD